MLAILGVIIAILGLLGLIDVVAMPFVLGLLMLIGGILLAAFDQRAHFRRL